MEKQDSKKKSVTLQAKNTPKKETKDTPVLSNKKAISKNTNEPQQKIRIKIRAYDHKVIDKSTKQIIEAAEQSGAKVIGPIPLPTSKNKFSVLKSSFVHKDARDQYEMRIHKRLLDIIKPSAKTIDSLMSLNLPAGVDIEIKM